MYRIVLRHKDDGRTLVDYVQAGSTEKAREKMSKHLTFYKINSVERLS